jgi:hypothetical protein
MTPKECAALAVAFIYLGLLSGVTLHVFLSAVFS